MYGFDKTSLKDAVFMFTFFIIGLFLMENVERILLAISSSNPQTSKSCSLKENPCSLERYLIILSEIYSSTPSIAVKSLRVALLISTVVISETFILEFGIYLC